MQDPRLKDLFSKLLKTEKQQQAVLQASRADFLKEPQPRDQPLEIVPLSEESAEIVDRTGRIRIKVPVPFQALIFWSVPSATG